MKNLVLFYSLIPGFDLTYGGTDSDFTTFRVSSKPEMYLNLEFSKNPTCYFGRFIFYTDDGNKLYQHLQNDDMILKLGYFETKPSNASWGERYFHMRDPDGYELSFSTKLAS